MDDDTIAGLTTTSLLTTRSTGADSVTARFEWWNAVGAYDAAKIVDVTGALAA